MKRVSLIILLVLAVPVLLSAQVPGLTGPDPSPAATVSQVVGLTTMEVSYHRPAVNGRQIWGGLVPENQVWRAGANENTTVSFSTPVTVNGTPLPAGTYGLHMIPTEGDWTVIFSKQAKAWGSFTYDEKEDAARIKVRPQSAEHQERLGYAFDEPTNDSVVLAMRWEKVRVPLEVEIDRANTVMANFEEQLRGLPRFGWQAWNQAANWALNNDLDLDKAMTYVDASISRTRNFNNLRTKAQILERKGQTAEATKLNEEAMLIANEADVNTLGYQLIGQQKVDEAIELFRRNVKDHPESWNAYDSLAEAYGIKGDKKKAIELYTKAHSMTTDPAQKSRINAAIEQLRAN